MTRYLNRRRALWAMLVLLALIVACGPGEMCESDSDRQNREMRQYFDNQQKQLASEAHDPPRVLRLEAKLKVPVTTYTVTAVAGSAALTYEWSMAGEACGSPTAPWKKTTGPSVQWSHSDQKPDACAHKGTDHAVDTTVVVVSPSWRVTCTIHGTEDQAIDHPKCTTVPVTATPGGGSATPAR
jgi:hypothetical protein